MRMTAMLMALILAGCATTQSAADDRDALVASLAGTWANAAQFDAAPAALKVPPSVEGDWLDLQHALFAVVDAPLIGDRVLYLEWRSGGPEGPISRQRIWSFRNEPGDTIRMDFFAFMDGTPWAGRAAEAGAFTTLTTAALRGYGPACALRFVSRPDGFLGQITADECTLTAASGRSMGIDARVSLGADGVLEYSESGRLADGRYAFRVPPSQPYRFERLP